MLCCIQAAESCCTGCIKKNNPNPILICRKSVKLHAKNFMS